jgi:HAD superfamily hydrolase (TIGR01509 family)
MWVATRTRGGRPTGTVLALDVDGVLLDSDRGGKGRWQQALGDRYGLDPTLLDEAFFQRSWSEVIMGRQPIEPALTRALLELHWEIDVEDVLRCWFESDLEIDHEVVQAVGEWAATGIRVALVTNQEARRAGFLERRLAAYFPMGGVAFSGGLGVLKSDPAFYPAAERWLGIEARSGQVVFVDDSLENVAAAERHGWLGVHFERHLDWRAQIGSALAGWDH